MNRILVVDDNETFKRIIRKKVAERIDLAFDFAGNGIEASGLIEKNKPVMILLDLIMPVMDGMEFLTKLRNDPETKDIPVVIVTGSKRKGDVAKAAELGVTDYLLKPLNPDMLYKKFLYLLSKFGIEYKEN